MTNGINFTLLNKTTALIAKRNSGKSVLSHQLIDDERHLFGNRIFLFSPTEQVNGDYSDIIDPKHIFDNWSETWGEKLVAKLQKIKKEEQKPILLVFDDMGSESSLEKSKVLTRLFVRGRHFSVSVLILVQYIYQVPRICRANLDWVLAGQQPTQAVDILTEEFNIGLKPDEFRELYKKSTLDYGFFLINNSSTKDQNIDSIYGKLKANYNG